MTKHMRTSSLWLQLAMRTGCRVTRRHWKSSTPSTKICWKQCVKLQHMDKSPIELLVARTFIRRYGTYSLLKWKDLMLGVDDINLYVGV